MIDIPFRAGYRASSKLEVRYEYLAEFLARHIFEFRIEYQLGIRNSSTNILPNVEPGRYLKHTGEFWNEYRTITKFAIRCEYRAELELARYLKHASVFRVEYHAELRTGSIFNAFKRISSWISSQLDIRNSSINIVLNFEPVGYSPTYHWMSWWISDSPKFAPFYEYRTELWASSIFANIPGNS